MGEIILSGLKKIAEAWKGIVAIGAIAGIIGGGAIFLDHWKAKNITNEKNDLRTEQVLQNQGAKLDSLLLYVRGVKYDVKNISKDQGKIIKSFADHLANDKSVTKDDLRKFMEQFIDEQKKSSDYSMLQTQSNRNR